MIQFRLYIAGSLLVGTSILLAGCSSNEDAYRYSYKAYNGNSQLAEEGVFTFEVDTDGHVQGTGTSTTLGKTPLSGQSDGTNLSVHLIPDNFTDIGIWFDGTLSKSDFTGQWGRMSIAGNGSPEGNFITVNR